MALTKIDDRGLTTPIDLLDNEKIRFGTGNDLEIYHDGSNSFIDDAGTGNLVVRSSTIAFENAPGGGEVLAKFITDGAVELYYDNSKKFETTSAGTLTQGDVVITDAVYLSNTSTISSRLTLNSENASSWQGTRELVAFDLIGNGADHRTGNLSIKIKKASSDSDPTEMMRIDGTYNKIRIPDSVQFELGDSGDLQIYHDGTESTIRAANGPLDLRTTDAQNVEILANDKYSVWGEADGMTALYWNGARKFETTQYGAKISTGLSAGYLEVSTTANLGDGHIEIIGGEAGGAVLSFTADEGDDNADKWRIQNAGDSLLGFRTKDSGSWVQKMKIGNDGHVTIDDGDLVIGTAGHGIDFSAQTQSSSTTDSELLDHYEKGKWDPVLKKNDVANATPDIVHGRYVRVGQKVWLSCYMRWNSGSNAQGESGGWTLHGLPFSIQDDNPGTCRIYQFAPIGYFNIDSDEFSYGHDSRWQANVNTYLTLYTDVGSTDLAWNSGVMQMSMTGTFMIHE